MGIVVAHQPAAGVIGGAAYLGGLGEYKKWLRQQQEAERARGMEEQLAWARIAAQQQAQREQIAAEAEQAELQREHQIGMFGLTKGYEGAKIEGEQEFELEKQRREQGWKTGESEAERAARWERERAEEKGKAEEAEVKRREPYMEYGPSADQQRKMDEIDAQIDEINFQRNETISDKDADMMIAELHMKKDIIRSSGKWQVKEQQEKIMQLPDGTLAVVDRKGKITPIRPKAEPKDETFKSNLSVLKLIQSERKILAAETDKNLDPRYTDEQIEAMLFGKYGYMLSPEAQEQMRPRAAALPAEQAEQFGPPAPVEQFGPPRELMGAEAPPVTLASTLQTLSPIVDAALKGQIAPEGLTNFFKSIIARGAGPGGQPGRGLVPSGPPPEPVADAREAAERAAVPPPAPPIGALTPEEHAAKVGPVIARDFRGTRLSPSDVAKEVRTLRSGTWFLGPDGALRRKH